MTVLHRLSFRRVRASIPAALVAVLLVAVGAGAGVASGSPRPGEPASSATGTFTLQDATIADLHRALQTRRLTCRQLVQLYLDRIAAYDQAEPALNAIIKTNPAALDVADARDAQLRRAGSIRRLGPMHCVPVIVKDNYDTFDLPTTAGSLALAGSIPPDDAFQVRKLRAAGAIVLAKSNMAEFAWSPLETVGSLAGTTRNPYDRTRSPAGSSGGTAAAIAANLGAVGLGTDTGNSIRGPASHNALVGIRSTMGLTSRDGIVPLFLDRDIGGPITRSVEDAVKILDVIAGFDPADPVTAASIGEQADDYTDFLDKHGLRGARIGVWRQISNTATADPEVLALFDAAIGDLEAAGATVLDPFVLPDFSELTSGLGCNRFRFDINNYLASLGPNAPFATLTQMNAADLYHPSIRNNMRNADRILEPPEEHPGCVRAVERRGVYRDAFLVAMDANGLDAVVYPTWSNPPREIGGSGPTGNNSPNTAPQLGAPALTVPMGFTYGSLPAGLQLLGRPFGEPELIRFAYAYEQATQHRHPPADYPPLPGEPDRSPRP